MTLDRLALPLLKRWNLKQLEEVFVAKRHGSKTELELYFAAVNEAVLKDSQSSKH